MFVNYRVLAADGGFLGAISVGLSIDTLNRLIQSYGETYRRVVHFVGPAADIRLGRASDAGTRNLREIDGLERLADRLGEVSGRAALAYNDVHGHVVGDAAIRHCASTLSGALRDGDFLCRWGGEEFCMLLEGCAASEARAAGVHLRSAVEDAPLHHDGITVPLTVSLGVGERRQGVTLDDFLARVDRALHAAKEHGRNRVHLASEEVLVRG